jgi:3-methyladenine DNA glycosylase AlkC
MPAASAPDSSAFKHWFDAARYRQIADEAAAVARSFDRRRFLELTLTGLDERSLMERVRQTAVALDASLPGAYPLKLDTLRPLAPRVGHSFVSIALCDFVSRFGLGHFDLSLEMLRYLTPFGSAEFAVRPFLIQDQPRALQHFYRWAADPDEHVRRLASEGSRPRLPWGVRLVELVRDPEPTAPILEALKADPALYVRKSVANHLNDIAKDHPDAVLARVRQWDHRNAGTAWIIRHGLRTLIKRGHAGALSVLGADQDVVRQIQVQQFSCRPTRLRLGDVLELAATLTFSGRRQARLIIDYVVHYVKASGETSAKVFKWSTQEVQPGAAIALGKRQTIRDFSTRRHYPGIHRIELQVNGHRLAETQFRLQAS